MIKQIASPADAAAFLLGGAVGIPVDYLLLHLAIRPGTASFFTASTALGIKKWTDALRQRKRDEKKRDQMVSANRKRAADKREQLTTMADSLKKLLTDAYDNEMLSSFK